MKIVKAMVGVVLFSSLTACSSFPALYLGRDSKECWPGSACYAKLTPQQQEDKRQEWMMYRQRMESVEAKAGYDPTWTARPLSSYNYQTS